MEINVNQPSANKATQPQTTEPTAIPQNTCTDLPEEYSYLDVTYYTVTPIKFILFSFLTGGLYVFFWAFKNWRVASNNGKGNGIVMPVLLTLIIHLSVLGFVYRIKGTLAVRGLASKLSYLAVFVISFAAINMRAAGSFEEGVIFFGVLFTPITITIAGFLKAEFIGLVLQTAVFAVINNRFITLNSLKHSSWKNEKKIVGWEWLTVVIFIVANLMIYTDV